MLENHQPMWQEKLRHTNLELFRIITMLLIIAHHYVVNSGLTDVGGPIFSDPMSGKSLFLLLLGAWGKTGINCFVLISGYFMCRSSISARKFAKLYFEIIFYYLAINSVFWITGYSRFSWKETFGLLLPISYIADIFGPAYLLFFLCIPFLNVLVQNLTQRMHAYLLLLVFFLYVIPGTVRFLCVLNMNYISWFIALYFLSSYVRMYPNKLFDDTKFWGIVSAVCIVISAVSVVVSTWLGMRTNQMLSFYFVTDSNTFLALATGFSSFMFFKNVNIPHNPCINKLASTCFGVLCFHANSDAMRKWLWVDMLNNVGVYQKWWMPIHAIVSVISIFLVGAAIDVFRMRFVEKPFFKLWDKQWEQFRFKYKTLEKAICNKLSIQN